MQKKSSARIAAALCFGATAAAAQQNPDAQFGDWSMFCTPQSEPCQIAQQTNLSEDKNIFVRTTIAFKNEKEWTLKIILPETAVFDRNRALPVTFSNFPAVFQKNADGVMPDYTNQNYRIPSVACNDGLCTYTARVLANDKIFTGVDVGVHLQTERDHGWRIEISTDGLKDALAEMTRRRAIVSAPLLPVLTPANP